MRWAVAASSLPWIFLLSCPQAGTFVLTLPSYLRRKSPGATDVERGLGEDSDFRKDFARAPWICARGGSTMSFATMRNGRRRQKIQVFCNGSVDGVPGPAEMGHHRGGESPRVGGAEVIHQCENTCNNGNPAEAEGVNAAESPSTMRAQRRNGDKIIRDNEGGGNRTPSASVAGARESTHLKLRAMHLGTHQQEKDGGLVDDKAKETLEASDSDDFPPGKVRLLEYRSPRGESRRFASLGGDVSKFALYLDAAVSRGVLEPPIMELMDSGEASIEEAIVKAMPMGMGRSSDSEGRIYRDKEEGNFERESYFAAAADPERPPATTENMTTTAEGRWTAWITVSIVDVTDERVQEALNALWESERLVSQERDATDVLRGGEPCFADLLMSYTTRTKAKHWEDIPPRRLLDVLEEYDPEVRSRCGYDPDRPDDETLSLLRAMLKWFKKQFPYYYDECHSCGNRQNNTFIGYVYPTEGERAFRTFRTEVYHCSACGATSRFPRYAAVSKVLETRRGRCGEYSVLMLRLLEALGYECRWVVDWSDHVWVEARVGRRWVHVDPCEAAVDEPLLYESWGKNQTFIFAFTPQEVVDVTHEYTSDLDAAKARRGVGPEFVAESIASATRMLQEP